MTGLQPGTLQAGACQDLPLRTDGAGIRQVRELCRAHTCSDSSVEELPSEAPVTRGMRVEPREWRPVKSI